MDQEIFFSDDDEQKKHTHNVREGGIDMKKSLVFEIFASSHDFFWPGIPLGTGCCAFRVRPVGRYGNGHPVGR